MRSTLKRLRKALSKTLRVSTLPVTVVMPPDTKKPCNGVPPPPPRVPPTPHTPAPAMVNGSQPQQPQPQQVAPSTPAKRTAKDFIFGKTIGEGSFSTVYLAKDIHTSRDYAIKVCEKMHLIREKKTEHVKREKKVLNILSESGTPFFVKLYCTFQDAERLYFVLSYAKNGELLAHINRAKQMSVECARFYAAEIVSALEQLRVNNVIHRDLKPENILLDENMHVLITDFGSAKIVHSPTSETESDDEQSMRERKNSFVGTAQYISPELLRDKSASFSSDLWALGCVLYQMLAGTPPFQSRSEYIIFQKIQKLDYEFPENFDPVARDLIQKLLVLDPTNRLGASDPEGYPSLKNHPFFSGVLWDELSSTVPPALPPPTSHDHWVPDHLEPGLDRGQLSRLLGLDTTPAPVPAAVPTRKKSYVQGLTEDEIRRRLEQQQQENKWHTLVEGNLILKQGLIEKRKLNSGLFARRRMLFLTLGPHLYYADPYTGQLKGEIRWTPELKLEPRTFKNFYLHCQDTRGERTYSMEDPNSDALEWIKAIDEMHQAVFGQKAVSS
ncbi:putative 3-phosphoinositide-dependent protein kinase 2 isoform X2 [Macrosteles quadrilineatus]|uniref:putative 3-phosphoinositide-dependent protein kinase 2 isoform X2 n=1 Tax=Macrosteles quadrilineatus TaxID=74068 RepID=UPI0023E0E898|nr:putative 3-phosphoinositide-dependent protein kinase 2 isoform X2 [Macrosteles quadrilineatus]XP_054290433.1 putative 3-phosphoinositide-dependent protein kinase 2 isoform X2 [Macrosteles quadrilineatus]